MTKDATSIKPGKGFTIELPEGVKKSLPKDFDIGSIGNIDLNEAEAIANENVLLLNESDLIEGLEDFDLIPLKESARVREETAARETKAPVSTGTAVLTEMPEEEAAVAELPSHEEEEAAPPVGEKAEPLIREEEAGDGRTWIPLHEIDSIDEQGRKWVPIHELAEEEHPREVLPAETAAREEVETAGAVQSEEAVAPVVKEEAAGTGGMKALSLDDLVEPEPVAEAFAEEPAVETAHGGEPVTVTIEEKEAEPAVVQAEEQALEEGGPAAVAEGHVDETDEYMIWDMPDSDAVIAEPVGRKEEPVRAAEKPLVEKELPLTVTEEPATPAPSERAKDVPLAALRKSEKPLADEIVPPRAVEGAAGRAVFIDDKQADGETVEQELHDENRLEKIISGIVQVDEGASYVLREANAEEDRQRIATITEEFRPAFEEMSEDLEYKYADEEMDYIHTAIVEEDYSSYIREIDEFFATRGGRTVSARLELLGLTADEFDSIEDMLFKEEYRDVNLYDRYHLYEFDRHGRGGSKEGRQYRYLLPAEESLIDAERDSIESDVSSSSALIFEEDVQDIREQLMKRTGKTDVEAVDLFERAIREEAPEEPRMEIPPAEEPAEEPVPEPVVTVAEQAPFVPAAEQIFDITDRVVILEDQADVERFVRTFPEPKQVNIKMLLKYLDGLFERLPEDIIRKFASSDYFNLYLKVLNELGV